MYILCKSTYVFAPLTQISEVAIIKSSNFIDIFILCDVYFMS